MNVHVLKVLIPIFVLPGLAVADPWKDESGYGRHKPDEGWRDDFGEPPAWARGKGHGDGHFKHGRPPIRRGDVFGPPVWQQYEYRPLPPMPYGPVWRGDKDFDKEWRKEQREWRKELREREKEAYKKWRERQREGARFSPPPPVPPSPRWW